MFLSTPLTCDILIEVSHNLAKRHDLTPQLAYFLHNSIELMLHWLVNLADDNIPSQWMVNCEIVSKQVIKLIQTNVLFQDCTIDLSSKALFCYL